MRKYFILCVIGNISLSIVSPGAFMMVSDSKLGISSMPAIDRKLAVPPPSK